MRHREPKDGRDMKSEAGPPMTLGNAAAGRVRLTVWCKDCRHQVEPDPAQMAWHERLVCSTFGGRQIGRVVADNRRLD
jgi:hypothetical protein